MNSMIFASAFRWNERLRFATPPPLGPELSRDGQPVGAERTLRACAPEGRGLDLVAVERHLFRVRVSLAVHALVAQLQAVRRGDVARCELVHTQFTFMPAAFMMARLTAVRAIWTL